jgi:hypothetical protein
MNSVSAARDRNTNAKCNTEDYNTIIYNYLHAETSKQDDVAVRI